MATKINERVYLVQFPHPGAEHDPKHSSQMGWNTGAHKRRFLRSRGRYVDGTGAVAASELLFWGEWEAGSKVVGRYIPEGRLPSFLQEAVWGTPPPGFRQNTDPWVFGDTFLYSNCKQLTPRGNPSQLQSLTPGSVVLFGSQVEGQFALDTVFVVADATPYVPARAASMMVDEAFRFGTIQSLAASDDVYARFTLFRGATFDQPVAGMYSFVPSHLSNAPQPRFTRPAIDLPGYVNPDSKQSPSGAHQPRTVAQVREQWERVREQVLAAGCLLGVWFPTPEREMVAAGPTMDHSRVDEQFTER